MYIVLTYKQVSLHSGWCMFWFILPYRQVSSIVDRIKFTMRPSSGKSQNSNPPQTWQLKKKTLKLETLKKQVNKHEMYSTCLEKPTGGWAVRKFSLDKNELRKVQFPTELIYEYFMNTYRLVCKETICVKIFCSSCETKFVFPD